MGNAQSLGAVVEEGIKVYKTVKEQQEEQAQQQQGGYHQQPQQEQHYPSHSEHIGPTYHQVQEEHDDPEYSELRAAAHEEAEKRNACYQRSQEAYHSGDGALAKEESNQGHHHDELMKQYNKQAADLVYAQKNENRPPTEIDLHGLFVQEASQRVDEALRRCERENYDHLVIIVGKGLHSPGHIAKLKPAIIDLVQRYQVQCTPNVPNPGCLYIEFGKGTGDLSWLDRFTDKLSRNDVCAIM
ncbi:hypothetical protein BCR42DRAFT_416235 [Absidia repens]|uniref:Smr domain-containing protein n=1 Tax=Absidia repens TaxID=90262 RepID=A0A1X2IGF7_9FUNG|nr:hypothetical protein BCR42DRAFT_416235 [Absidia repens]